MTWNYRIIRQETKIGPSFGIHEVYYGPGGKITRWTENTVGIGGENFMELLYDFVDYAQAFRKPILRLEELEKKMNGGRKNGQPSNRRGKNLRKAGTVV